VVGGGWPVRICTRRWRRLLVVGRVVLRRGPGQLPRGRNHATAGDGPHARELRGICGGTMLIAASVWPQDRRTCMHVCGRHVAPYVAGTG
jgi:hypothetical protein